MNESNLTNEAIAVIHPQRSAMIRAALLFVNFFLIIAALYQLKPASRSLYIELVGSGNLPYVWIATALTLGLIITAYHQIVSNFSRIRVVIGSTMIVMLVLGLFYLLLARPTAVSAFSFYIFVDILSVILVEQFWSLSNAAFDEQEGRKWYALIGTGGLLGGVIGGWAAGYAISALGLNTLDLLLVAALILTLLILLTLWMRYLGLYRELRGCWP